MPLQNPVYSEAVGANLCVRPCVFAQVKGRHTGMPLQNPVYSEAVGANRCVRPSLMAFFFHNRIIGIRVKLYFIGLAHRLE